MRIRPFSAAVVGAALAIAAVASAQSFRQEDPEAKKDYLGALAKGETAAAAKDWPGAATAFQDAIKLDTSRMLGFYRLGEVQLVTGKLEEADATWTGALNKKGAPLLKAKLLWVIAEGKERQNKLPAAKEAWNAYLTFVSASQEAKGYPALATQHIKVIDRRMKDEVDYAAVKERIAKRIKEHEAEAMENAKKDKLNR